MTAKDPVALALVETPEDNFTAVSVGADLATFRRRRVLVSLDVLSHTSHPFFQIH